MLDAENSTRILNVAGGFNFRELGGYQSKDGRHIKTHKLIRSAHLGTLTAGGQKTLTDYGVISDIDLRSDEEVEKRPDLVPTGVQYYSMPIFRTDATQSTRSEQELNLMMAKEAGNGHKQMMDVYKDMVVSEGPQKQYRAFFNQLLANDQDNQSVLFHCTAGKDRTGMGAVFALSALNIPVDQIKRDYLLTNSASRDRIQEMLQAAYQRHASDIFIDNFRAMITVQPDFINHALDLVNKQYGGMNQYLHDILQLSDHDLTDLQQIYLEN